MFGKYIFLSYLCSANLKRYKGMRKILDFIKNATIISGALTLFIIWICMYGNEGRDAEFVETMSPTYRKAIEADLRSTLGREPSVKEIADYAK